MHKFNYVTAGKHLEGGAVTSNADKGASKALILLHGRGGSTDDILSLADALPVKDFALFAPQADGHSWYPYSFMSPLEQNEPWLSGALHLIKQLVAHIENQGVIPENIWFTGFSQGACLMLEFLGRHAGRYGGAAAFTGGLIGDRIYPHHYHGDFRQMPIFIGTSNPDPHVPVQRVHDTTKFLKEMNAKVTEVVYPGMGHTIIAEEVKEAGRVVFNVS